MTNKTFKTLTNRDLAKNITKNQQNRISICKDVIKQINCFGFKIKSGRGYVRSKRQYLHEDIESIINFDSPVTKKDINDITSQCTVCALGSLLLSRISLFNKLSWIDSGLNETYTKSDINPNIMFKALEKYFSRQQLCLIESAFECRTEGYNYFDKLKYSTRQEVEKKIKKSIDFGKNFNNDSDRLLAIMQNIVDHKGTFEPEVIYEVVTK